MFDNTGLIALIIEETLLLLFVTGNFLALFVGLFFLLLPEHAIRFNRRASAWASMRQSTRALEITRNTEPMVYRHSRLFGLFAMSGAIYVLYRLGFHYNHELLVKTLGGSQSQRWLADWLLSAFLWFSVPAMLLILITGAALAIRPSSLKRLELLSNRWISTRRWILPLEKQQLTLDELIGRHPRLFGIIVMTLSAYAFAALMITYMHYLR